MKRVSFKLFALPIICMVSIGCASKAKTEPVLEKIEPSVTIEDTIIEEPAVEPEPAPIVKPVVHKIEPVPQKEPEPIPEPVKEPEVVKKEPEPAPEPEPIKEEVAEKPKKEPDEFKRSTGNVEISREKFNEDKAKILNIIDSLSSIMAEHNFAEWSKLIDSESYNYYSKKQNLKKAQDRLPKARKGLQIKTLEDYFNWVFVPARLGRSVDEIRYITESNVKVVQISNEEELVYYNFVKRSGEWKIVLPKISD